MVIGDQRGLRISVTNIWLCKGAAYTLRFSQVTHLGLFSVSPLIQHVPDFLIFLFPCAFGKFYQSFTFYHSLFRSNFLVYKNSRWAEHVFRMSGGKVTRRLLWLWEKKKGQKGGLKRYRRMVWNRRLGRWAVELQEIACKEARGLHWAVEPMKMIQINYYSTKSNIIV